MAEKLVFSPVRRGATLSSERPVDVSADETALTADPSGRAAILLVESLLHVMRERSLLSTADLVDIVDTALAVQRDTALPEFERSVRATAVLDQIAIALVR